MAVSICENGKTLEKLNLNSSDVEILWVTCYPFSYFQEIIKCCQELKEVDLAYVNEFKWRYHYGTIGCEVSMEGIQN